MAGSRIQQFGTIFKKVKGLIRAGAMKEDEKPLWYDVYAAFPPKVEPKLDRQVPKKDVVKILYPEDFIRVEFYNTLANPDIVDLSFDGETTKCQRFVDKYIELQKENKVPDADLFQTTLDTLRVKGYKLVKSEDVKQTAISKTKNG